MLRPPRSSERGSILLLLPAAALVMIVLGSIAVDLSLLALRHRQAVNVAAATANDAVTAGLDPDVLRERGLYVLRADLARRVAAEAIASSDVARHVVAADVEVAANRVTVRLTIEVRYVVAHNLPFASDRHRITVEATATAVNVLP